jgi:hypothetical protein
MHKPHSAAPAAAPPQVSLAQCSDTDNTTVLIAFSAAVWSIYLATLSPGVAGGDTGELLTEACHLGELLILEHLSSVILLTCK